MDLDLRSSISARGPRYVAIADAVQRAIALNALVSGQKLPTHRDLAKTLDVDVGTITRAYAELKRRGLIETQVGNGSFVCQQRLDVPETLVTPSRSGLIDLSHNFPPASPVNPLLHELLECLHPPLDVAQLMGHQTDIGQLAQRQALAQWLTGLEMEVSAADLVLTTGAQHGLLLALQAVSEPGDTILTESHTYYGAMAACAMLGRTLTGVAMDQQGLLPEALDQRCRETGARVLYCTPTLHNPTTATMDLERRQAIIAVCREHGLTIIEDDVYRFLLDAPLPSLWSLDPGHTLHLSSLSKIVGPGLRLGFIVAARRWHGRLAAALRATTLMAPALVGELAARLAQSGALQRMALARREQARQRQQWAQALLAGQTFMSQPTAFHIWLKIGQDWSSEAFSAAARERDVGVSDGHLFALEHSAKDSAVRVCICAAQGEAELREALSRLNGLLADGPLVSRVVL